MEAVIKVWSRGKPPLPFVSGNDEGVVFVLRYAAGLAMIAPVPATGAAIPTKRTRRDNTDEGN